MTNKCVLVVCHRRRRDWQQRGQLERRHGISEWGNWNGSRKRYITQRNPLCFNQATSCFNKPEVMAERTRRGLNTSLFRFPYSFWMKSRCWTWWCSYFNWRYQHVRADTSFSIGAAAHVGNIVFPPQRVFPYNVRCIPAGLYLGAASVKAYFWWTKPLLFSCNSSDDLSAAVQTFKGSFCPHNWSYS